MTLLRSLLGALVLTFVATAAQAIPTITVAPGASPGGYLPLEVFGVAPIAIGDEEILNFTTPGYVYAGQTWTRMGVTSNGYIVVGGGTIADVEFVAFDLPDPIAPKNILAPFWTDLTGVGAPGIFASFVSDTLGHDWIVVEWQLNNFATTDLNIFQVWLGINGVEDITFVYGPQLTAGAAIVGLTVGANDSTGLFGDSYYFSGAGTLPTPGTELRVTTSGFEIAAVPEPATLGLLGAGLIALTAIRRRRR